MRKVFWTVGILGSIVLLWWGIQWLALFEPDWQPGEVRESVSTEPESIPPEVRPTVETIATGLDTPWSLVFTSDERILVAERPGRIRVIEDGKLLDTPLHIFAEVSETGEEGLMSLTLDPNYTTNRYLYASLAYQAGSELSVKVMRFTDAGERLIDPSVIIDQIPAAKYHAGSAIAFGPDGKLYITTGDATDKALAQDLGSLAGKTLRLNPDGSIPSDNPFSGSAVWSYGHRNSQGIAWHPVTKELYSSEHGPSVFDGPAGGDEVNRILKGGNYGWPMVSHEKRREGTEAPIITFTPAQAPASMMVYSGKGNASWKGNLFFGALRGEGLMRLELDPIDPSKVVRSEKLSVVQFGRIRAVAEAPDGSIYFTTSNRDGRGKPVAEDDRVMRLRFQ